MDDFKRWLKEQSRFKLVIAAGIIIFVLYIFFLTPRSSGYLKAVAAEIEIAKQICINSEEMVIGNIQKLKLDSNILNDVPVNGEIPKLKYVPYPKIIFMRYGYSRNKDGEELYCTFKDPRGTNEYGASAYYYDYKKKQWVNRTRTRR